MIIGIILVVIGLFSLYATKQKKKRQRMVNFNNSIEEILSIVETKEINDNGYILPDSLVKEEEIKKARKKVFRKWYDRNSKNVLNTLYDKKILNEDGCGRMDKIVLQIFSIYDNWLDTQELDMFSVVKNY